eukprot:TRINITY_DN12058_c0_g1_i1.p1 TRINITY_DN12058_c0_g1~~TRINITY_DN12058_c0_g1_i1.p1  ORF type:complete len:165 (+),score=0.19 TRINITY_DN12058_c0_g1_i1:73-567(+)
MCIRDSNQSLILSNNANNTFCIFGIKMVGKRLPMRIKIPLSVKNKCTQADDLSDLMQSLAKKMRDKATHLKLSNTPPEIRGRRILIYKGKDVPAKKCRTPNRLCKNIKLFLCHNTPRKHLLKRAQRSADKIVNDKLLLYSRLCFTPAKKDLSSSACEAKQSKHY